MLQHCKFSLPNIRSGSNTILSAKEPSFTAHAAHISADAAPANTDMNTIPMMLPRFRFLIIGIRVFRIMTRTIPAKKLPHNKHNSIRSDLTCNKSGYNTGNKPYAKYYASNFLRHRNIFLLLNCYFPYTPPLSKYPAAILLLPELYLARSSVHAVHYRKRLKMISEIPDDLTTCLEALLNCDSDSLHAGAC
mgnify:CR=1 FL=1